MRFGWYQSWPNITRNLTGKSEESHAKRVCKENIRVYIGQNKVVSRKCAMQNITMLTTGTTNIFVKPLCNISIYEEIEGTFKESFHVLLSLSLSLVQVFRLGPRMVISLRSCDICTVMQGAIHLLASSCSCSPSPQLSKENTQKVQFHPALFHKIETC